LVATDLDIEKRLQEVPVPDYPALEHPFDLMIAGVGGTGVVTVGALITMAAHLEGKGASVLDFTGFAQKFGTVIGYIRLAEDPNTINQVRIDRGSADAVIACDAVVASSPKASVHYQSNTNVVLNLADMPTGDLVLHRDANLEIDARRKMISNVVGPDRISCLNANHVAEQLMGNTVYANVIMLGYAWQLGLVPVSLDAIMRALELNNVAVQQNCHAFAIGRIIAHKPESLDSYLNAPPVEESLETIISERAEFLVAYQNQQYADRFVAHIQKLRDSLILKNKEVAAEVAARSLFNLMAYKDEYEVARLYTELDFEKRLSDEFQGDYRVIYHFAPPLFSVTKDARGRPRKQAFGPWIKPVLRILAKLRFCRGTPFDIFRYSKDRRLDRKLLAWYEKQLSDIERLASSMDEQQLLNRLSAPLEVRGFGPVREAAAEKMFQDLNQEKII